MYSTQVPTLSLATEISSSSTYDSVILLSTNVAGESVVGDVLKAVVEIDAVAHKEVSLHFAPSLPGKRLILAPVGPTNRDFDDVRSVTDVARAAVARAKKAGSTQPLLYFGELPRTGHYEKVVDAVVLAVYQELYQPLQARETVKEGLNLEPVTALGVFDSAKSVTEEQLRVLSAVEASRRLARDLADADGERMSPVAFAKHVEESFAAMKDSRVKVTVIDDRETLEKEYPLLSSVARASRPVARHQPRVVRLQYIAPDAEADAEDVKSLFLVGKGVTYDTGGADVKTNGIMMGMSRDKTGAAVVAGFMYLVGLLNPSKMRVFAELGIVRNSVGSEMYVSDENIRGHSGLRVKIVNTDAEGRLVMADCLSHLREIAVSSPNPQLVTIATLTGHAGRAFGPYTVLIDNGPAQQKEHAKKLAHSGSRLGDMCELSSYRREDFQAVQPKKGNPSFDVLQLEGGYSRGHQFASAFMIQASGLGSHGIDAKVQLPYTYIDIAPSACEDSDYKYGKSVAASLLALYGTHLTKN